MTLVKMDFFTIFVGIGYTSIPAGFHGWELFPLAIHNIQNLLLAKLFSISFNPYWLEACFLRFLLAIHKMSLGSHWLARNVSYSDGLPDGVARWPVWFLARHLVGVVARGKQVRRYTTTYVSLRPNTISRE